MVRIGHGRSKGMYALKIQTERANCCRLSHVRSTAC